MAGVGLVTVSLRRSMYSGMFLPSVVEPLPTQLVADGHGLCYTAHLIKLRHNSCLLFLSLPLQERMMSRTRPTIKDWIVALENTAWSLLADRVTGRDEDSYR